LSWNYLG